jgi:hypothetical protein
MNVFIPVGLLAFALFYTLGVGFATLCLFCGVERQKTLTIDFNRVVLIDALLCVGAAISGAFL